MTVQSDTFSGKPAMISVFEGAGQGKKHDTAPSRVACQEPDWVERQISVEAARRDLSVTSSTRETRIQRQATDRKYTPAKIRGEGKTGVKHDTLDG